MNQYERELLEIALENYRKTGQAIREIIFRNGDEFMSYSDALDSLIKQGYVEIISGNYDPESGTVYLNKESFVPHAKYKLTEEGLKYATTNLKV